MLDTLLIGRSNARERCQTAALDRCDQLPLSIAHGDLVFTPGCMEVPVQQFPANKKVA